MNHSQADEDFWDRYPAHLQGIGRVSDALGLRGSVFVLGDPSEESAPAAVMFQMPPGCVVSRHAHTCERVEVVVAGSIDVGDRVLRPGDVMTAGAGEAYGDHVAGPDGCTTVEIFSTLSGMHLTLFDTPDGMKELDLASPKALAMLAPQTVE